MKNIPDNSVDSIVTDPPYGISFMGKHWDYNVPTVEKWRECLRVLKLGGHLLSFAGTRTYHRMAVNIEDAGFEIRDMIAWIYGSGFPKSLNIGKAVDKLQGNERDVIGKGNCGYQVAISKIRKEQGYRPNETNATRETVITKGNSEFEGFGTVLKPALEPICVARKPLIGTVAANVLQYGTGGINIDGCRVDGEVGSGVWGSSNKTVNPNRTFVGSPDASDYRTEQNPLGRFPANLIHDGSEEVLAGFPDSAGQQGNIRGTEPSRTGDNGIYGVFNDRNGFPCRNDSGSAARFFYCAKASKEDRDEGLCGLEKKQYSHDGRETPIENAFQRNNSTAHNNHPTVKPTALMRYLCRLVTPPNGIILDPFFGSGSTGKAAKLEGFNFIGIEREVDYCEIAKKRIDGTLVNKKLEFKEAL